MKNLLSILALIAAIGCMVLSLADGIDRQITVDNLAYGAVVNGRKAIGFELKPSYSAEHYQPEQSKEI